MGAVNITQKGEIAAKDGFATLVPSAGWSYIRVGWICSLMHMGLGAPKPFSTVPAANRFVAFLTSCDAALRGEWGT